MYRQADEQTGVQMDRQVEDGQDKKKCIDLHRYRWTDRQMDRCIDRQADVKMN